MDVFALRDKIILNDYTGYSRSFLTIQDKRIEAEVNDKFNRGLLWPEPLVQLNPSFAPGGSIDDLVNAKILHPLCSEIFRMGKDDPVPDGGSSPGRRMQLYRHQKEAIEAARSGDNYILTTGTGSGKSLSYIVPVVDDILRTKRQGAEDGKVKAIIVYPMNALANSQEQELTKFLAYRNGQALEKAYSSPSDFDAPAERLKSAFPVTFARYTGQESFPVKQAIIDNPPDILLTNYMMLELLLTRVQEQQLLKACSTLRFLVFDELHTYGGRQGSDVAILIRRLRAALCPDGARPFQCIGTSATLAGPGTFDQQKQEVAELATRLFGSEFLPERIIMETLQSETVDSDYDTPAFWRRLTAWLASGRRLPADTPYTDFVRNPLSVWIERNVGIALKEGRLVRCTPRSLGGDKGLAADLSAKTGIDAGICKELLREALLSGSQIRSDTGRAVFAFKLHQFISKGDTVYTTLEAENKRHITLFGQKCAPDRDVPLFPMVFCRECGRAYYSVAMERQEDKRHMRFTPLPPRKSAQGACEAGYLYVAADKPWPDAENIGDSTELEERLPEEWFEQKGGTKRIIASYKKLLPKLWYVQPDGRASSEPVDGAVPAWFVSQPFKLCLDCGVFYNDRASDFVKLATLSSEGRSTATTVLSMSAVQHLREEADVPEYARKLLCFTDNRQDASLQAGHFNDFIQVVMLRSALYQALADAGADGMMTSEVPGAMLSALERFHPQGELLKDLSRSHEPARDQQNDIRNTLMRVFEYLMLSDLIRGWRIVAPNLEQCGMMEISCRGLDALCSEDNRWEKNAFLRGASAAVRRRIVLAFLDFLRQRLILDADVLDEAKQKVLVDQSRSFLTRIWHLEDVKALHHGTRLYRLRRGLTTRPRMGRDDTLLSARTKFGRWTQRWGFGHKLSIGETEQVLDALLDVLGAHGLLTQVARSNGTSPNGEHDWIVWQINAGWLVWKGGDGRFSHPDRLSVRDAEEHERRVNPFFVNLYRNAAGHNASLQAHEHTGQVPSDKRREREDLFREGKLPVLYCSPTMELGVDISLLTCVAMRNVPPTPANYAQRSGRAGRSGQPALVITYCLQGSSHDQYFFRCPEKMVAGAVTPPRVDLAGEDLLRAHVHAMWLSAARLDLKKTVADLLELGDGDGASPSSIDDQILNLYLDLKAGNTAGTLDASHKALYESLESTVGKEYAQSVSDGDVRDACALKQEVETALNERSFQQDAMARAKALLDTLRPELDNAGWYTDKWLTELFEHLYDDFDSACDRWRDLYLSCRNQYRQLTEKAADVSLNALQRNTITREIGRTGSELNELQYPSGKGEFYSYRYFASEGFLPGYNFPRLPLTAHIGESPNSQKDDNPFVSRPRFLAISEFGPGSIIYYEGARYTISRVRDLRANLANSLENIKLCSHCGCFEEQHMDVCSVCGALLPQPRYHMFRMRNVETRLRSLITSDEEERMRVGYELVSAYHFVQHGSLPPHRDVMLLDSAGEPVALLRYGHGATLMRINLGWSNRAEGTPDGFLLDLDNGTWHSAQNTAANTDDNNALHAIEHVIPYVQDTKNCLVLTPARQLESHQMYSLQAALTKAILNVYQLDDDEIDLETLPSNAEPASLLFIESPEGGAGVLRRLVDEEDALPMVAREALAICHFSEDGEDLGKADSVEETCRAACYNCLMTYGNQRLHEQLDRFSIRDVLLAMARGNIGAAGACDVARTSGPPQELETLLKACESRFERKWLKFIKSRKLRLPDKAQHLIEVPGCTVRADFFYEDKSTVIFIDGPVHDSRDQRLKDEAIDVALGDAGYFPLRFADEERWLTIINENTSVFKQS